MVLTRRHAAVGLALLLVAGTGSTLTPASADPLPGVEAHAGPSWEEPLETEPQPAVFDDLGPAPESPASRTSATAPDGSASGLKITPLLRSSAWSWYLDPRVIEDRGRTTFGALANNGHLQVVQVVNASGRLSRFTIARDVKVDDHNSAALLRTAGGRYAALWSGHGKTPAFLRVSRQPNSIDDWSPRRVLTGSGLEKVGASYAVLFRVPQQTDQYVAIVRRKTDALWVMTTSRDLQHWSKAFPLVRTIYPIEKREQPYLKFAFDGTTLHVLGSDRQPGVSGPNKLYHFSIGGGVVRRTDGSVVDTLANVQAGRPVDLRSTTLLYDGAGADGQVRVYDIAVRNSEPIVAVTSLGGSGTSPAYKWARFRNGQWQLRTLVRQSVRPEGMTLDTADPRNVYLSYAAPGEAGRIVHLRTRDDGETWSVHEIGDTPGSRTPTTPVGSGGPFLAMWLHGRYTKWNNYDTTVTGLTTGRRPVYLTVTWRRGRDGSLRAVVLARQGYTTVPAEGVPVLVRVTNGKRTTVRAVGSTNRSGRLVARVTGVRPGSTVRFVVRPTATWGAASSSAHRLR